MRYPCWDQRWRWSAVSIGASAVDYQVVGSDAESPGRYGGGGFDWDNSVGFVFDPEVRVGPASGVMDPHQNR